MSHFKYEINERNLRLQLKENKVPFNDEAWNRFESFAEAHRNSHSENVMQRFSLSLNRNVVLPVIFGTVIILFSFLLFNFVNIKNPHHQTAEAKPAATPAPATAAPKKELSLPKKEISTPVQVKDSVPAAAGTEPVIKDNTPEVQQAAAKPEPVATRQPETIKKESSPAFNEASHAVRTEIVQRKKHKKREPVITEPTAGEDDQLPPPVPGE